MSKSETEKRLEEALSDRHKPVPAAYVRRLVARYLRPYPDLTTRPTKVLVDDIFPASLRLRFGLAPGARLMMIDGNPPGAIDALTSAFQTNNRASWTVSIHVLEAGGTSRDLSLDLTGDDPGLPPDPPLPPSSLDSPAAPSRSGTPP